MALSWRRLLGLTIIAGLVATVWLGPGPREPEPGKATAAVQNEPQGPDDVDRIYAIGNAALSSGAVTEFDVSGWNGTLDLTVSSLLPGDARDVADGVCRGARESFAGQWKRAWTLRVFILTNSDRPAAVCRL